MKFLPPIPYKELSGRLPWVVAGVALAHLFAWREWCAWNARLIVAVSTALGMPIQQTGPYQFTFPDWPMYVAVSCTFLDAYLGSLPLLWEKSSSLLRNFLILLLALPIFVLLNLVRLELGFALFLHGWSWNASHEIMAAFFYFGLLEFHCRNLSRPRVAGCCSEARTPSTTERANPLPNAV